MPFGSNSINYSSSVRVGFVGAGLSSVSAIAIFAFRDQIQCGLYRLLSILDWDWIRNPLRLLSPHSSGKAVIDTTTDQPYGTASIMITSAITMELKCGLLCSMGEDIIRAYGQFPLLNSTSSLLGKLGFELVDDSKNVHKDGGGDNISSSSSSSRRNPLAALLQPCEDTSPIDSNIESLSLSEGILRALDDVRDLKHRVEKEEQNDKDGKSMSRRAKRINFKVDSLEKQRAKMLEKQKRNENGTEDVLEDGGDSDDGDMRAEIRDAWMRIARVFNSARLLLFLFSEEDGLDTLARYDFDGEAIKCGNSTIGKDGRIKSLNKTVTKLSDALEILTMPSTSAAVGDDDVNGNNNDNSRGMTKDALSEWEKYISVGIRSRRNTAASSADQSSESENEIGLIDFSAIDLTGDSSIDAGNDNNVQIESNLLDDLSDEMFANAVDTSIVPGGIDCISISSDDDNVQIESNSLYDVSDEVLANTVDTPIVPEDVPPQNNNDSITARVDISVAPVDLPTRRKKKKKDDIPKPKRCISWNSHLDRLMKDFVSTLNTNAGGEEIEFSKKTFATMSLDNVIGGYLRGSDATSVHIRAKNIDERFSLIVGITGSKEHHKRKRYLLSIERLRHRVEQTIRKVKLFQDARLDVYGSCLSGLSLGKNADVDLSLTFSLALERKQDFEDGVLTAKKYNKHVTDTVYKIKRQLEHSYPAVFRNIEAVPRARVPVIKGVYTDANNPHSEDGSLHFDVCLLNDIAVANSGLIKEYSDIDIRVKSLMVAVKRWTKDNSINSAQDNTLSSYTWINLVIFYLQCIDFVPNLQCPIMMRQYNHERGRGMSRRRQDNINNLNTAYMKWKGEADLVWKRSPEIDDAYASVSILLYGFFRFYSQEFPIQLYMVSIKRGGKIRLPKTMFPDRASLHLCIEDPFETFDSHFPHDLGTPADEAGSMFISRCFRNSAEHLRQILFGDGIENENDIDAVEEVWPTTMLTKVSPGGRPRKNRNSKVDQRDPKMTLIVEITRGSDVKKDDFLEFFQPFADQTGSKIVGLSLTNGGCLTFVDFDSVAAADAALAAHANKKMRMKGKALSVSPKTKSAVRAAQRRSKHNMLQERNFAKNESSKKQSYNSKGDPGRILVVESFAGSFSENGLSKMFRCFADRTKSNLVACDLGKKRNTAIIEYDSSNAVRAALEEHSKNPLMFNRKALDVTPKQKDISNQTKNNKGGKKNSNGNQNQDGSSPSGGNKDGNPPKGKGGKKSGRKKKQGGGGNKQQQDTNSNKPIVQANESIQGQL